jgi:hypothetical protein
MSTPLLLSHNYSKVLPVCQLTARRNHVPCRVILEEYFSTICALEAGRPVDHIVAELPAIADAQEPSSREHHVLDSQGVLQSTVGERCQHLEFLCGDHAISRSSTVSILAGHLHKPVLVLTVTYLIAIFVMSPTTFMPVLLDVKLTRSPTRRPALTRLPRLARFHLTASIID